MASLLSCFSAYAFRFGAGGYFSPDFPRGGPFILSSWGHFRWGSRPLLALARVAVASLLPWGLCLPCYLGRCALNGAPHILDLARVSSARVARSRAFTPRVSPPPRPMCGASTCRPKRRRVASLGQPSACIGVDLLRAIAGGAYSHLSAQHHYSSSQKPSHADRPGGAQAVFRVGTHVPQVPSD